MSHPDSTRAPFRVLSAAEVLALEEDARQARISDAPTAVLRLVQTIRELREREAAQSAGVGVSDLSEGWAYPPDAAPVVAEVAGLTVEQDRRADALRHASEAVKATAMVFGRSRPVEWSELVELARWIEQGDQE